MPKKPTSQQQQLLAENAELRARLEKAEATLNEIFSGNDALMISGADNAQLFTHQGTDQSYRALIENMSEGALTLSPDGLVFYANQRFAMMLRTPLEKVIGSEILNWFIPKNRPTLLAMLQKDAPDNHREELLLAASDGTQVPVYLSVNRLVMDGIDSICMVVTDLTEQKHNEKILAAQMLSNAILEQAAAAIVICDQSGRIMRASQQAQTLCGMSPLGQRFEQAFVLRQPDGTAFSDVGAIDTKRRLPTEARLECNGHSFDLLVSVGHLKGPEDELLGSVVTMTDISERRKAEDKLLEAKNFLQLVIDTVPYRIFWKDRNLRYLGCNTRFANDAGYTSYSEVIGKTDFDMPWKDHQANAYRKDDKAVMESGLPKLDIEEPQTTPDGNTIWVNTSKVPLRDKENQIIGVLGLYIDITERIRIEQELHLSERRFRTMFEQAPLGIALIDSFNGNICEVNKRFAEIAGRSMEEMLHIDWMQITHPGDVQEDLDNMAMMNAGKIAGFQMEKRYLYRDGTAVWIDMTVAPLKTEDKAHPRHLCMIQDITERKQAEQKIKTLALRYQSLLQTSVDGIHVLDDQGNIIEANDAFCAMLGYTQDEMAHLNVADWDAKWSASELPEVLRGLIGTSELFESLHRHKDGGLINVEISASGVMLNGHNYIFASSRNITEQKKAEANIQYLNRVYAMMSEINTLIVQVRDRDELFEEACRVAVETGGFSMAMVVMVDRDLMKIVPRASKGKSEELMNVIKKTLSSNELAQNTMVARAIREKRSVISNEVQNDPQVLFSQEYIKAGVSSIVVLPLILNNESIGALALYASESNFFYGEELELLTKLVDDIVFANSYLLAQLELHQLTDELENKVAIRTLDLELARQESDRANQAKSTFLAAMSHEIRTPMNGVIGMLDVLRQTRLNGHQLEMVDLIGESAFSLLEIIEDILDFSKIESGKLELELVPIALVDVVEKACDLLDHMATKKDVELCLFIDPAIPESVLGDALRLRQILVNLTNNAIKFSSGQQQKGRVSLRALLVENNTDQVTVEFQIIDNGIGMDEATQAQLFTPFTQADSTTTRRFGGTGLGLAISRDLVNLMEGEIIVQSAPDKGTTFTVRLSFTPLPAKTHEDDNRVDLSGLSCMVLGDQGFADDLAAYLAYGGATVEQSKDLTTAIKRIDAAPTGLWLFIIDARDRDDTEPVEELRNACLARDKQLDSRFMLVDHGHHQPGMEPHFVVIKRGRRRHGRIQSVDLVTIDGDTMHRQSFLQAVAVAAGRAQEIKEKTPRLARKDNVIKAPSREQAQRQGHLILVAEDNVTNQKVIQFQLGLLGFAADFANDGRQALERWESGNYGLLLTDLHMPNMDGYQLTAAIRSDETSMRRIPIIALTANTLEGESEHCLAAGMDDYLSKPARLDDLRDILNKWLPDAVDASADTPEQQAMSARSSVPVDIQVIASLVGDNPAVIHELLQDFQTSATKIAAELQDAYQAGDTAGTSAAAHKLKSSAFSVGAQALGELCLKIEMAGKADQIDAMSALLPRFEAEMTVVNDFLETI